MKLDAYELLWIGGGFTILGVLIGALVTYLLAISLARKDARREAGRRLREAFAPEIGALNPVSGDHHVDVQARLDNACTRHREAVTEFSYHLCRDERQRFLKAWDDYYNVGGSVRFFDYMPHERAETTPDAKTGEVLTNFVSCDKAWKTFENRVNTILSFTMGD